MFKAHTAISYEINNIFLQSCAPSAISAIAAAQPAPFPLAPLSSTCALFLPEITSVSFIATRTGIAYSKLHKEKFEKLIIFQPSHESNLLFPVTLWGYSSVAEHVSLAELSATTAIFLSIVGARGRRFNSCYPHHIESVAQLDRARN